MSEGWEVPCSDEDDDPTYMPSPDAIVELYNRINKGEMLNLVVDIIPRREPEAAKSDVVNDVKMMEEEEEKSEEESKESSEPNEFDFDSQAVDTVKRFTPKRTSTRPQVKKLARMDKVCSNILKYQKLDEAQVELEKLNKS